MNTLRQVIPSFTASTKSSALISKTVKPPNKKSYKTLRIRKLALAVALSLSVSVPNITQAATYTVTNTNDSGPGSLRSAIDDANDLTPNALDTIIFSVPSGSIINLLSRLEPRDSVIIKGQISGDPSSIILDGGNNVKLIFATGFSNNIANLTLENITLQNGNSPSSGGSITATNINLNLTHTIITNSSASTASFAKGGGLSFSNGNLTINHSTITGNSTSGSGGGLYVQNSDLVVFDSIISENSSNKSGGGLFLKSSTATITSSVFTDNYTTNLTDSFIGASTGAGGGIFIQNKKYANTPTREIRITKSNITNNLTKGFSAKGGGLYIDQVDVSLMIDSTISGNSTSGDEALGGGIYSKSRLFLLDSSISENSTTGKNANGGGIFSRNFIDLINTSLSGNATNGLSADGGGVFLQFSSNPYDGFNFVQSTITNNISQYGAGGISVIPGTGSGNAFRNTIVSGNTGPEGNFENKDTSSGRIIFAENSLFGDSFTEISIAFSVDNIFSDNPNIGPLQFNGGYTKSHKPNEFSPVINSGNNSLSNIPSDQRGAGFNRVIDNTVDIGSLELQNVSVNQFTALNPNEVVTRRDMAREMLKALEGENYIPLNPNNNNEPYQVTGIYDDVGVNDVNAVFIEDFERRGLTDKGCSTDNFCPNMVVTREQIAPIFLKIFFGEDFTPSPSGNGFSDVPFGSFNADWIVELRDQQYTEGCDSNKYCPKEPVTREWFDFLLSKIEGL